MLARNCVVAYGGDIPNYNLDSSELNTDPSFGVFSNPTPTIQENPTPAKGELVAFEWWDNFINGIRRKTPKAILNHPNRRQVSLYASVQKAMEDRF